MEENDNLDKSRLAEEAERELFVKLAPRVRSFFISRGLPAVDVDDLTQETMVRVFSSIDKLRSKEALDAWVLRVAANLWKNNLRMRAAAKRAGETLSLDSEPVGGTESLESLGSSLRDDHETPLANLLEKEQLVLLKGAIERLPQRARAAFEQYYLEDRRALGSSHKRAVLPVALRVAAHRARKLLEEYLAAAMR